MPFVFVLFHVKHCNKEQFVVMLFAIFYLELLLSNELGKGRAVSYPSLIHNFV